MRKATIAIILLLSVTAAFAQRKPGTKNKPAFQAVWPKYDNSGEGYAREKPVEIKYDFVAPVPYHGYTDVTNFPVKTKCDTVYIRDTIRIKDTVNVPIYLVDVTDTMPATVMYKKDAKSDRVYTLKGFALVRGFKVMVQNKPQWADKPAVVGALDDKKRLIKNVIQVL